MFEIYFTPLIIALLAVLVVSAIYLLAGFRHYVASVSKRVATDTASDAEGLAVDSFPPVSVIVYSEDDASNLEILLPQILDQDYPAP